MSIISASTLTTTALQLTADTAGTLVFRTGATPTTALTLGADQSATFTGAVNFGTAGFTNLSVTGVATFSAGTVSLPSITTAGDTNTGIYFPAADTIAFTEGGVESMRITSAGNVGIGTSSPNVRLHIKAGTSTFVNFAQENTNGGTNEKIVDWINNGGSYSLRLLNDAYNSANTAYQVDRSGFTVTNHIWYTGSSSERMRIDSTGNVSVASANAGARSLSVYNSDAGAGSYTQMYIQTNAGYFIQSIGSTANGALSSVYSTGSGGMFQYTVGAYPLYFGTNSTERMRIDSSGNVGIGTSSPSSYSAKLAITGNQDSKLISYMRNDSPGSSSASAIALNAYGNTWGMEIGSAAKNSNSLTWQLDYGGANLERMRLDTSGNLQLSTASTSILNSSGRKMLNQTGGILQVVAGTLNTGVSTSSRSFVDTGLQATITPSSTSSRIFILINTMTSLSNFTQRIYLQVAGGNTASYVGAAGTGVECSMAIVPRVDGGGYIMHPVSLSYVDSPATTSAITYKLQWWCETETAWLNRPNTQDGNGANTMSTITLMEIAG
jgi:hypothetical protein